VENVKRDACLVKRDARCVTDGGSCNVMRETGNVMGVGTTSFLGAREPENALPAAATRCAEKAFVTLAGTPAVSIPGLV
jgi:hypothetical protein